MIENFTPASCLDNLVAVVDPLEAAIEAVLPAEVSHPRAAPEEAEVDMMVVHPAVVSEEVEAASTAILPEVVGAGLMVALPVDEATEAEAVATSVVASVAVVVTANWHSEDHHLIAKVAFTCEYIVPFTHGFYTDLFGRENTTIPQPDATVTATEDARVKQTRGKLIDGYPGRPGYGKQGRAIVLRANYFQVQTAYELKQPEVPLYRYAISLVGIDSLSKTKTHRLVEMILETALFKGITWATDFSSIIVTTTKLELGASGSQQGKIELRDANEPAFAPEQPTDSPQIQQARKRRTKGYKIDHTNVFDLRQLVDSLKATTPGSFYAAKDELRQLLNIIVAKAPNAVANIYSSSQNKYYPDGHALTQEYSLGAGLRALRGYYSSVRTGTSRILLNLNVSSAAFYKPISLRLLMNEFLNNDRVPRHPRQLEELEGFLRLLRVQTNYLKTLDATGKPKKDNNGKPITAKKTKTIFGFAKRPRFGDAKQTTFSFNNAAKPQAPAQTISVFDYFKQEHGIQLQHWNEPVLNVGSVKDPVYLPVELCTVLPGQAAKRLLSGQQTAEMILFAARPPNQNGLSIAGTPATPGNGLVLMGLGADTQANTVQPFGFRVSTDMVTVPGRILSSPKLQYGGGAGGLTTPRDGSWNLAGKKFVQTGGFSKWSCLMINNINAGPRGRALKTDDLVTRQGDEMLAPTPLVAAFEKALRGYGINMGQRLPNQDVNIPAPTPENRAQIDKILDDKFKTAEAHQIDILLMVIPEVDRWLYSRIKYYGDVKYGIQTVTVVGNKFQKPKGQPMYFANVGLKFNIKGGGAAHVIQEKDMTPLDKQTMLLGIDVTHPSPGSKEGAPSIAAVVGSIDTKLCQWPGSLRSQTGRVEMVEGLTDMVLERLDLWVRKNQKLPTKIIIYRDGVSEGQYRLVLEIELPAIQEAFKKRYGAEAKWPKLTIVIVGKRHHTRFFPTRKEDADQRSWNPLAGTVVDRGVTDHFLWDFFLQAHQGLQGTARPAHYVVIMDQIGFEQDQLEGFTHKMCHLFNRATKAVSICPPAYYADLLCERGRAYLYSTLNENQSSNSSVYSATTSEWTSGVHRRIEEKTFYI